MRSNICILRCIFINYVRLRLISNVVNLIDSLGGGGNLIKGLPCL